MRNLKDLLERVAGPLPPDEEWSSEKGLLVFDEETHALRVDGESLTRSESGKVSLHGPTSFVRTSLSPSKSVDSDPEAVRFVKREWSQHLVSNALEQRALEQSLDTPVNLSRPLSPLHGL